MISIQLYDKTIFRKEHFSFSTHNMIKKVRLPRVYIASVGIDIGGTYFVVFKTRCKPEFSITGRGATFEEAHKNAAEIYEDIRKNLWQNQNEN
jgi:hypothetical protein